MLGCAELRTNVRSDQLKLCAWCTQLPKALEEQGVENETLVVFTADHGYQLGEKACWTKVCHPPLSPCLSTRPSIRPFEPRSTPPVGSPFD